MCNRQSLIDINIAGLQEGQRLLSLLNSDQYIQGFKPAFQSDIGTHFRHILEHYRCFFSQLYINEFRYDMRPRDARLQTDIEYAKTTVNDLIGHLESFDISLFEQRFTVSESYNDGSENNCFAGGVKTTLERELMFLQSHTVHHYAMIAAMTRSLGIQPEEEFGVAIPTRNYVRQLDQTEPSHITKVNS